MKVVLSLLSALVVLVLLGIGIYTIKYQTAEIRGKIDAHEQTSSGNSRLYNYNYFYDLCASIQGYESSISVQQLAKEKATNEADKTRYDTNVTAIQSQRMRAISQYNIDTRKVDTKAKFIGEDLPMVIDYKKERTECVN